jgi:hypothetical protein
MSSLLIGHAVSTVRLHNDLYFASKALFIYDFFLMFAEEISFILGSKWSPIKFVYLLSRYLPFVEFAVIIYHQISSNLSDIDCNIAYRTNAFLDVIGMAMSEALLSYRLWIIWKKNTTVAYGLSALLLALSIAGLVLMSIFVNSLDFIQLPSHLVNGCFYSSGSNIIVMVWILVLTYNSVLALLVTQGVSLYSGYRSPLIDRLYKAGLLYYAIVFVATAVNIMVIISLPSDYLILLSSMLRSLHSNVATRAILHIRRDRDEVPVLGKVLIQYPVGGSDFVNASMAELC